MIGAIVQGHVSTKGVDAIKEASQPASPTHIRREADTGIGHLYQKLVSTDSEPDVDIMRIRVFEHVGERFGNEEVGGSLDVV